MGTSRRQRASREGTFLESVKIILEELKASITQVEHVAEEIKAMSCQVHPYGNYNFDTNQLGEFSSLAGTWECHPPAESYWHIFDSNRYFEHQPYISSTFVGHVQPERTDGKDAISRHKLLRYRWPLREETCPGELSGLRTSMAT